MTMAEMQQEQDGSVPSMASTMHSGTEDDSNSGPPILEIVDRSSEPEAEKKATDLKNQGNAELQKGHILQAIDLYSQALEFAPTNAIVLSNRALAYIKVENYGLAIQDAENAILHNPEYSKAYYRRASANFALHHFKLARKDFRKVVSLTPKSKDAREKLKSVEKVIKEEAFAKAIEAEQTQPLSSIYNPDTIDISNYSGPHPGLDVCTNMEEEAQLFIVGSLPRQFVMDSIEAFQSQKLIHRRYVARILLSARSYFADLPSLIRVSVPEQPPNENEAPRVTVCGDTHGQFYDVLNIFHKNGYPSANNVYIFNGDFVDRGSFSVEVILTFLLFKLADPTSIYLSRGNHETKNMTRIYGFEGEVKHKFDDKLYQLFLEVFEHLPLVHVIENKVMVVHGGLPVTPNVSLDDITNIPRGMEPPESGLMSDLLWSDPQPFPGKAPSKRGVGFAFGPDITEAFLNYNNLDLLVRSHEVKDEGYLVEHGGKTITVFSAPNYCDTMGNKGAYIHFEKDLKPKYTQYTAVPHPDIKPMAYAAGMGGLFA